MSRKEEIEQYCIEQGFPQGACSSILEVKAIIATEAIKWADKTIIDKAILWLTEKGIMYVICESDLQDLIHDFTKAMKD